MRYKFPKGHTINTGRIFSEKHRKNLSLSHLGQVAWNKGLKGWTNGYWLGKKRPEVKNWLITKSGWRHSKEFIESISGENHYNWKGGQKPYKHQTNKREYIDWRKNVYERDNFTCQDCGITGVYLTAHHIKSWTYFPELRYEVSNGKTLCEPCHSKTDNYKGRGRKTKILASENSMRIAVATL